MRTIIDIPQEIANNVDAVAKQEKRSKASVIRSALSEYLANKNQNSAKAAFGIWKNRKVDGLEYQSKIRSEW